MRFYLAALAELGLAPLAAAPLDVRIHRALFFPAFHPHACVTVTQYQDLVELHVAIRDALDLRVDIAPPSPSRARRSRPTSSRCSRSRARTPWRSPRSTATSL